MEPLTAEEARVLGVLIEKQMTTPDQYPLTINSLVSGANQKNNRDPVLELDEAAVLDAADGLLGKGLAVRVEQAGARVPKYRHAAAEKLDCRPAELALLSELLLRGPQTTGELRGRASRMQPFESLPAVEGFLRTLMDRPEPLVRRLPPAPGTRAEKYEQLLGGEAVADEPAEGSTAEPAAMPVAAASAAPAAAGVMAELTARVAALESETAALRAALRRLAADAGLEDPIDS